MNRNSHGFTLIEVVVAVTLSGIVLLGARQLIVQMADSASVVTANAVQLDAEANAERLLRSFVARLEVGTPEAHDFSGTERETRFTSWCDVAAGWQERRDVRIAIDSVMSDSVGVLALTVRTQSMTQSRDDFSIMPSDLRIIRKGFARGSLRYLNSPGSGGTWFVGWGRGITAPLALGVILDYGSRADTLILRIGERG